VSIRNYAGLLSLLLVASAGCASTVPPELISARSSYDRASRGPSAKVNPAGLHAAKQTLDVAEHSFVEEGDSQETRDLAYNADMRTRTTEARTRSIQYVKEKEQTIASMHASETAQVELTSASLMRARAQLGAQGQQLTDERERREEADRRAAAANAALAGIGTVKQEPRGMVITLSGAVLFASNKSELLPSAQRKLGDVANALSQQDPKSTMVVEGHADSQGADEFNQTLSQKRAESVRAYLITKGISAERLTAQGFGETRPIADNASAEGRANNRRVEIVVQQTQAGER